jgi:hypothetical protein
MLERPIGSDPLPAPAAAGGCGLDYYGLLYIDRKRNRDANLTWSLSDPIATYVGCASLLASSARACGMPFVLFTNAPDEVERIVAQNGYQRFATTALDFSRDVPPVRKFYSAHFKLDVMKALASGRYGERVCLIDVDTVFLRAMPQSIADSAAAAFVAYDVSSGPNPQHFDPDIRRDLELVGGIGIENPRWYGGELLAATSDRLRLLVDEIERCWPRYVANVGALHHIGDEMPVSAALNRLEIAGMQVVDAGRLGAIARWWPVRTAYPQPAFEDLQDRVILHLPGDKRFLASQAVAGFDRQAFLEKYMRRRRRSRAVRRLFDFLDPYYSAEVDRVRPAGLSGSTAGS